MCLSTEIEKNTIVSLLRGNVQIFAVTCDTNLIKMLSVLCLSFLVKFRKVPMTFKFNLIY